MLREIFAGACCVKARFSTSTKHHSFSLGLLWLSITCCGNLLPVLLTVFRHEADESQRRRRRGYIWSLAAWGSFFVVFSPFFSLFSWRYPSRGFTSGHICLYMWSSFLD